MEHLKNLFLAFFMSAGVAGLVLFLAFVIRSPIPEPRHRLVFMLGAILFGILFRFVMDLRERK